MTELQVVVLGAFVALVLGFALGALLAAVFAERGRNADLRELAQLKLDRDRPGPRVTVRDPATGETVEVDEEAEEEPILRPPERERMIEDIMEQSAMTLTRREAEVHVDELLGQAAGLGHGR